MPAKSQEKQLIDAEKEVRDRLKNLIYDLEPSMEEFCRKIGFSAETLRKKLKTTRSVGLELLFKIHQAYPMVNLHWILTGEGGRVVSDDSEELKKTKDELVETQRQLIKYMQKGAGA